MLKFKTFSKLIIVFLILSTSLFAQSGVGKLVGSVLDAETGEALIGANVILVNTTLGAAANIDGHFTILNINPGTYEVKFSFVGYQSMIVSDVRIVPGVTNEIKMKLQAGVDLGEIVVTDSKLFEEKATNTVKVLDSESIDRLPVKGVSNLASLQAGVVKAEGDGGADGNATLNIRGGRGGEVVYIVDGVVQNDPLYGTNRANISNAAVEQISFQVGGYEAKYGQAQSGIINVTTKSGSPTYKLFVDGLTSTYTDDYGYNMYTATLGGPIVHGNGNHTFFVSAERGWFLDNDPSAQEINFESIGFNQAYKPNNTGSSWKYSAKTFHNLPAGFTLRLGANYNENNNRGFIFAYAKNNWAHNRINKSENLSIRAQLSQNLSESTFWNMTVGWKAYNSESGDGVFFDDLTAYGDTLKNSYISVQGDQSALALDSNGIFSDYGRLSSNYSKDETISYTGDFNITSQLDNHLVEAGIGGSYNTMRYYSISPVNLALGIRGTDTTDATSAYDRYSYAKPYYYGYDLYGNTDDFGDLYLESPEPVFVYGYLQDRFELEDLVLNVGVRFDYFDSQAKILSDPYYPYSGGSDATNFDAGDFVTKEAEFYVSPRIGLGFPVTETTVFHAQYGKFVQAPRLFDLYPILEDLRYMTYSSNYSVNNGYIESEVTTQYEIGFRQVLGENTAALNITAFYKNTEGLANQVIQKYVRSAGGEVLNYYTTSNSDFGTVKGLAFTLDIPSISYFSSSLNYTYSISEGTGSSQNSSFTAAFRNTDGYTPKVIAPLDFDQRHTGVISLNFFIPKGENGLLEMLAADLLISFNSGRPYTPLETQNLLEGSTNWGDTKGYVNSRYAPGSMKVDLKVEKTFALGNSLGITPYVWVDNLFDAVNAVNVWRSTGSPETTGYLSTDEGKKLIAQYGEDWKADYEALERNPANFGVPRLIKLGLKLNFSTL